MDSIDDNNLPQEEPNTSVTLANEKKVKNKKKRKTKLYTTFKCEICSKHFSDKDLLASHVRIHAPTRAFACNQCEYTCKTRQYLARHVKILHSGPPAYECRYCDKKFNTKEKLQNHTRVHTGEKPYECGRCGKCFSARYSLQTHMYIHTNEKPFKCAYCPYACRDSSTLRKHQQRHLGIKSLYQCKTCGQEYTQKYALKNHVAEVHLSLDINKHECAECGKMFRSKNSLSAHRRAVHDTSQRCECELCGKTISNRNNLRTHMRTHVDTRPFTCKHGGCDKAFKDPSSLRKHEVLHTPSEFYPCEICGREFARYSRLVSHIDVHAPRAKVECHYCGTKFLSKNYLAKHIRQKHARKRQKYICDMCDFVTHNKPSIVMHIKYGHATGHNNECKECGKKFKQVKNLNVHYLKFHGLRFKTAVRKLSVEVKTEPVDEPLLELNDIKQEIPDGNEHLLSLTNNELSRPLVCEAHFHPNNLHKSFQKARLVGPAVPIPYTEAESEPSTSTKEDPLYLELTVQPEDILQDGEPAADGADSEPSPPESHAKEIISSLRKELRKVPEEVFDQFYIKKVEGHEKKIKHIPDPKLDEVAMNNLRKLVAETRQHDELLTLERTRQQYNERMRALLNSAARKKDKVHVKHFVPNKCTAKENTNSSNETVNKESSNNNTTEEEKDKDDSKDEELSKIEDINDEQPEKPIPDGKISSPRETNESNDDYTDEEISKSDVSNDDEPGNTTSNDKIESPGKINEDSQNTDDENSVWGERGKDSSKVFISKKEKDRRKKNWKIKFNTHQCYICFKLYETKEQLLDHCKEHFDVCNNIALKKCPLCEYVTKLNITRHLKLVHKVNIKIPYAQIKDKKDNTNGSRYYYEINDEKIKKLEIIPSIKNLNKMAMLKIDSKKRDTKNMMIAKTKLVRKGKEWIVEHEDMDILKEMKDHMLPEVSEKDIIVREKKLKIGEVWSDKYVDRLKRLYKIMKKKGVKMLFPCEDCDKICQTAAALKLHVRRHDKNAKPFRKKVWKHKLIQNGKLSNKNNKNLKKNKVTNKIEDEEVNPRIKPPKVPKKEKLLSHRLAKPKPIVNKHKCDPQLMEFYEKNIRGGNIEFWQFLKIFNKMDREKINDFKDLEKRTDFGIHFSVEKEVNDEVDNVPGTTSQVKTLINTVDINKETKKNLSTTKGKKINRLKNNVFKRVIRLSRSEHKRRNELKDKLREKIAREKNIKNNQCSTNSSQQDAADA